MGRGLRDVATAAYTPPSPEYSSRFVLPYAGFDRFYSAFQQRLVETAYAWEKNVMLALAGPSVFDHLDINIAGDERELKALLLLEPDAMRQFEVGALACLNQGLYRQGKPFSPALKVRARASAHPTLTFSVPQGVEVKLHLSQRAAPVHRRDDLMPSKKPFTVNWGLGPVDPLSAPAPAPARPPAPSAAEIRQKILADFEAFTGELSDELLADASGHYVLKLVKDWLKTEQQRKEEKS